MNTEDEYGYRVKRVLARVVIDGKEHGEIYDLIFDEENRCWIVFDWQETPDGKVPRGQVEIDGRQLQAVPNSRAEYWYAPVVVYRPGVDMGF
jgi:hypothetical protein